MRRIDQVVSWRRRAAVGLSVVLAALAPFAAAAAPPAAPGAGSPQALVERLRGALAEENFREVAACLAPAERREMALALLMGSSMMVAFMEMGGDLAAGMAQGVAEGVAESAGGEVTADQRREIEAARAEAISKAAAMQQKHAAILERHGLTDRLASETAAGPAPGPDASPEAGLAALLAGVDEGALIADLMTFFTDMGESEERRMIALPPAVTDYRIEGDRATARAGEETVEFVRVEGRWYFKPSAKRD
jgi:hypothetical protein